MKHVFQTPGTGLRRRNPVAPIGTGANAGANTATGIQQPQAPESAERDWQGLPVSELRRLFPRGIYAAQALEETSASGRRWFFASSQPFAAGSVPELHFTVSETVSRDLNGTETPMLLLQKVVEGDLQLMFDCKGDAGRFLIAYPGASATTGSESAPVMF